MTGTLGVLVIILIVRLLVPLVALAASSFVARRDGQYLKSMRWPSIHGYTAEFFPPGEERKADHNR